MAQISHGSITITDITDISDLYFEYCLVKEATTLEQLMTPNYFYTYTATQDTEPLQDKQYYIKDGLIYTPVTVETGENPQSLGYYERELNDPVEEDWGTDYPNWQQGYNIWIRQVQQKEEIQELLYGTPYLDTANNQLNNEVSTHTETINSLETKLRYFWNHLPQPDEAEDPDYPYGTYMAAGIEGINIKTSNSNTYGYNSLLRHSAIQFRYNDSNLTSIGQDGIFLNYLPNVDPKLTTDTTVNQNKVYYEKIEFTEEGETIVEYMPVLQPKANPRNNNYYELEITTGQKGIELTTDGLSLYTPNNSNKAIELSKEGLMIRNGSIILGDAINDLSNANPGSIALSLHNFDRNISNQPINNLRFAIGDSFGVTDEGRLYAYDAIIQGKILIGPNSGSNVYTTDQTFSKEEVESTYITENQAAINFLSNDQQITQIQIIYKAIKPTVDIDNPGTQWITGAKDTVNTWTTIRPSYNTTYSTVYYAIQTRNDKNEVNTSTPMLDNGMSDILTSNGQIDNSKIDASKINIGELIGTLSNDVINNSELTTTDKLTQEITKIEENVATNYIGINSSETQQWRSLFSRIELDPDPEGEPCINIAAKPKDGEQDFSSYLHLTGKQINFVVDHQSGSLLVTSDDIVTKSIRTTSIYMGLTAEQPTLGWVLRDNKHLSLKILQQ